LVEHLNSDELFLFSTDYPHWQFDGDRVLPDGLSGALLNKIISENALATYPRLAKADRAMEISV
jgi:predicted TIM-barrel fold metal-dependent hydrolase